MVVAAVRRSVEGDCDHSKFVAAMRRVTAAIADNIRCFMIEPRCLIEREHGSELFRGRFTVSLNGFLHGGVIGGRLLERLSSLIAVPHHMLLPSSGPA